MSSPYEKIPGKIFVGGIPPSITQSNMQKHFSKYGELADCVLMQDKMTGKSRGFGFVTFKDSASIDKVLKEEHKLDGKDVDCKRAVPRDQYGGGEPAKEENNGKTKKIFVGGLPQSTSEDEFRGFFEKFGKIEDSVIMVDKETGKSRGFGFITFDTEEAVEKVIESYYDNKISDKWVECKKAFPRTNTGGGGGSANKRGGPSKPRYGGGREYGDHNQPPPYGGSYGAPKDDPYYPSYGEGAPYGGYYPKSNYPGYQQPQEYYDDRAGYWNPAGGNPYNPQYMGQYPGQSYPGYGAPADTRGAYPMEGGHPGMMPGYASRLRSWSSRWKLSWTIYLPTRSRIRKHQSFPDSTTRQRKHRRSIIN